jgi:hypothetical protein
MASSQRGAQADAALGGEPRFSLIGNELPLRWYRRLRLVPADALGTGRRAVVFAVVTWLPIFAWAGMTGSLVDPATGEALLHHYGIQVLCLIAVPLFILAQDKLHGASGRITAQFVSTGIVTPAQRAAFEQTLRDVGRVRDAALPWLVIAGLIILLLLVNPPRMHEDDYASVSNPDGTLGFGGLWFGYVARPVFLALFLGWIWRILLTAYWLWRLGRLDLSLVPTHPDRAGGLAFVEKLPGAFALVTFGLSAVIASHWAHEMTQHGATLPSYAAPAAIFAIVWTLLVPLPLLALAPRMVATRARGIPAYSKLVGEQGRLVHRRWILGESVGEASLLDAPEIGPVADASAMYAAVRRMQIVPIGKASIAAILLPVLLPMIAVATLQLPFREVMLKLLKAVM